MKWLTAAACLTILLSATGCWRPYYGRNYAPNAVAQPQFAPGTYQPVQGQPVVQGQPFVQGQPVMQAQPMQMMQAAPMQCQPCTPQPYCVPCY